MPKEIRTVAFFSRANEDSVAHIRFYGPARHLGLQVVQGAENDVPFPERAVGADLIVLQRDFPVHLDAYEHILALARQQGVPVVLELDDLLLELPTYHPDRQIHHYTRALLPIFQAITEVDLVTVTTQPLADYVAAYNPNVSVLPNYLDDDLWHLRAPASPSSAQDPLVIGFMGGASHLPDLEMIGPVLEELADCYPGRLQFRFWGLKHPTLLASRPNVEWHQAHIVRFSDFVDYFQRQSADIFIAPLRDNLFNVCKSPIKFLEYSALGIPGVFSRIAPYSEAVKDGRTGLLASSQSEWKEALVRLIEDPQLRFEIAANAQEDVQAHWLLSKNASRWSEAYRHAAEVRATTQRPPLTGFVRSAAREVADGIEYERQLVYGQWQQEAGMLRAQLEIAAQQLHTISESRAWRTALALKRLRERLAPDGSLQARVLKRLYSLLVSPFIHRPGPPGERNGDLDR